MPCARQEVHKQGKGNGQQMASRDAEQLRINDMGMTGHACASLLLVALTLMVWDFQMHEVSFELACRCNGMP